MSLRHIRLDSCIPATVLDANPSRTRPSTGDTRASWSGTGVVPRASADIDADPVDPTSSSWDRGRLR
jgi:hypothetical protein